MKTFGAYKDSGVDGIGDIPNHWEPVRLKYLASVQTGRTPKIQSSQVDFFENGDTNWFTPADFDGYGDLRESKRKINANALDEKEVELFPENSIYLVSIGATLGRVGMCMTKASANQQINVISFSQEKCDARFGFYFLQGNSQMVSIEADYTTLPILNQTKTKNLRLVVPKLAEQTAIAAYLDRKTAEIDELIESKRRLLELYEEEKTAIINQAVTRGINPDAPMKDSGIDWLGEVPAHWEVKRLKHVAKVATGRTPRIQSSVIDFFDNGEIDWFTPSDFSNSMALSESRRKVSSNAIEAMEVELFPERSIYLVSIGATLGRVAFCQTKASANQQINVVSFNETMCLASFGFYFISGNRDMILLESDYTTLPILNQTKTKSLWVAMPSILEQQSIVHYIETESHRIDTQKARTQKMIDLLTEYRTALISEVVTGKVRVV